MGTKNFYIDFLILFFPLLTSSVVILINIGVAQEGSDPNTRSLSPVCTFRENLTSDECYVYGINEVNHSSENYVSNNTVSRAQLVPTVNFTDSADVAFWKTKVRSPTIPEYRYFHVAEPSFASNGSLVFYTGNHFASRLGNNSTWEYVDPYSDFKGVPPGNFSSSGNITGTIPHPFDLFWADQHVTYSPTQEIYIWVRQGKTFDLRSGFQTSNIDRLAVSKDTLNWTAYDIQSDKFFTDLGSSNLLFDYPQMTLGNKYLYLTTSLINQNENKTYGVIFRFDLDDLGNLASTRYDTYLDKNVDGIAPVDGLGKNDTVYFGTHLSQTNKKMRIYEWKEDTAEPKVRDLGVDHWNDIRNVEYCSDGSDYWWCKADYSDSRVRSAWMFNDKINFLWNAVTTNDNETSWIPYIEVATFKLNKDNITYENSTKYHVTDKKHPWIYGAAMPSSDGRLGLAAYTASNTNNPYMNLTFGIFNETTKKWEMMNIMNSSHPLPVINDGKEDYNWGDFLTIRQHIGNKNDNFIWDIGGFVLFGSKPQDTDPFFIMVKDKNHYNETTSR